jgi:hypothetical protein
MKKISKYTILAVALIAIGIIGCTVAKVTPATSTTPAFTEYSPDPRLTNALATAGAINSVTAPVNPYSFPIQVGLGAVAAIAAWVAKNKTDKANQQALLLKTVIQGVENAAQPAVKEAIKSQASAIGVEGELSTTVQKVNSGQL